jgi:DNA repair protein RadA/Sms
VYVSTIGGAKITEPAADIALLLAIVSALEDTALPVGTITLGEVGLAGELRPVTGLTQRLNEAARLGFRRAIIPATAVVDAPQGMQLLKAQSVADAVNLVRGS